MRVTATVFLTLCGCGAIAPESPIRDAAADAQPESDDAPPKDAQSGEAQPDAGWTVLATGAGSLAIAIDDTTVYWASNVGGTVRSCPKSGCNDAPTTLWSNESSLYGIAVDATRVYTAGGGVIACPKSGCAGVPTILSSYGGAFGIAVNQTTVVWAGGTYQQSGVMTCPTSTCVSPALITPGDPFLVAADATSVFWTDRYTHAVMKAPATGGGSVTLAITTDEPRAIAVDADNVYWTVVQGDTSGAVMACAKDCVTPRVVASQQPYPSAIAVDHAYVYWANTGVVGTDIVGSIMRCPLDGCVGEPTTLVTGQGSGIGIAVDATSLYWASIARGTINRLDLQP